MLSTTRYCATSLVFCAMTLLASPPAGAGGVAPTFSKAFTPSTIGPGSVSTLRFDITNADPVDPVDNLAFTDPLPAGVTVASAAVATSTCGGVVDTSNPTTIDFSGGMVGTSSTCSVFVNVVSAVPGIHMNVSGALTSDAGGSGPASADLTVATDRPGFSKSFSPNPIALGGRSTLTFTVDNTANASQMSFIRFIDNLPAGMVVADPANVSSTCTAGGATGGVVTAVPGTSTITLGSSSGFAAVAAGAVCTITVDVSGTGVGQLGNVSETMTSIVFVTTLESGKASALLEVTADPIALSKDFTDDPVPPGGTVTLEFTIANRDRNLAATDIAFSDNLTATLAGLAATGLPANDVCGAGSVLSGTGTLSLTGGNLPAQGSCTFSVTLQVPLAAVPGAYPNTTSPVTADLGGSMTVGAAAVETLFVDVAPRLTKTFIDNPVTAGVTTRLEFTLTNTSPVSTAMGITFFDDFPAILPTATTTPGSGFCGPASSSIFTPLFDDPYGTIPARLTIIDAELAPGASCTFSITLDVVPDAPTGGFVNTTSPVTATIGGAPTIGVPAVDTLLVVAAPDLSKNFTDDPVAPGSTVTLEFTLNHSIGAPADATAISFTDDLNTTLAGLTAVGLPTNDVCGVGSQLSGTTSLTFTNGTLAPGTSCTFSVSLQVPAAAPTGSFNNTTSDVTAMVSGLAVANQGGTDVLVVTDLVFTKSFVDDPVIPGGTVTLEFTIDNIGTLGVTGIFFTDSLSAVLSGLASTSGTLNDICGAGSQLSGTTFLIFTGGNLLAGESCTFSITADVPAAAASGTFTNTTSNLTSSIGTIPSAIDALIVESNLLFLTKAFTDDPVDPGGTVTLEFTLQNLDPAQTATGITFTDDLGAALTGLVATGLPANDVCGAGSQVSGSNVITLTGGNLPAGGSCTWSVVLDVPASAPPGGVFTNTTSAVSGTITGLPVTGNPASDDLLISTLVNFSKAWSGPVFAGDTVTLSFTIDNQSTAAVNGLAFTDDLAAVLAGLVATGLPLTDVCGGGSLIDGTSFLTFSAGSLGASSSCTIDVPVQVPSGAAAGAFLNTTSDLSAGPSVVSLPATAPLTVGTPPLFSKSFAPAAVGLGGVSTLTFTIDNTANVVAVTGLDFTDNLPAGTEVANPNGAVSGCTGGTLTATSGSGTITYTGGTVGAGAVCTLSVDIVATAVGTHVNVTGDLMSSAGVSSPATATLTAVSDLGLSKTFLTSPVAPDSDVILEFTLANAASQPISGIALTDDLDAVVPGLVAVGLPLADVCGLGSTLTGTSVVSLSGASLGVGASCTFQVTVHVPADATGGTFTNVTSPVSGTLAGGAPISGPAAAGDLVISRNVLEIPTIGTWGLLLLGALLSFFGVRRVRQRA